MYKYYAQHMHMHSCFQPGASMEGHMYHARNLNMKYIWFTDHDIRMGRNEHAVAGFDFEEPNLMVKEVGGRFHGFAVMEKASNEMAANSGTIMLSEEEAFRGGQSLCMTNVAEGEQWSGIGVTFLSSGRRHCAGLMAGVKLGIAYKVACEDWENARLIMDVQLSQRPPEHNPAHIIYAVGNTKGLNHAPHTLLIPMEVNAGWQEMEFDLSKEVLTEYAETKRIGGLDNAFDTLFIRIESREGTKITAWIDDFSISVERNAQETFEMQKCIAKEKGKINGITPFVGMEISEAGPHKNCFSGCVPIIPYEKYAYQVTHEQGCDWVKRHGGIFALNHPFECFKRMDIRALNHEAETQGLADKLVKSSCWGATLIEVGFPEGRYFPMACHLKLWDILGMRGIFLTGYGSSDNHSNQSGWYEGNNFATWLGVEEGETEPIEEAVFVRAMKSGRAYTGNPVRFVGRLEFATTEGAEMGSVVEVDSADKKCVRFYCEGMQRGWIQRWVVNGNVVKEHIMDTEILEEFCCVTPIEPIQLVRAEIYDERGVCVLLTNPVYFYRKDLTDAAIPIERLVRK